jgi:hypothetical protein
MSAIGTIGSLIYSGIAFVLSAVHGEAVLHLFKI